MHRFFDKLLPVSFVLSLVFFLSGADSIFTPVDFSLADVQPVDVKYRLFASKDDDKGTYYDIANVSLAKMDLEADTSVLIHGYTTTEHSPWYNPMRKAYFDLTDVDSPSKGCNVLYIDWSKAGNKTYEVSAANSKPTGSFIGEFILAAKFKLAGVHIVGHSLGSHVAGFVGKHIHKTTGKNIARITGTDPAWPKFDHPLVTDEGRLSKGDATFVDIIHTDGGHYGIIRAIGHVDFYPNGGYFLQPGCPPVWEDDNCSHAKSNVYFIESIRNKNHTAVKCDSYLQYRLSMCNENFKTPFGQHVNKSARGTFYLNIS